MKLKLGKKDNEYIVFINFSNDVNNYLNFIVIIVLNWYFSFFFGF